MIDFFDYDFGLETFATNNNIVNSKSSILDMLQVNELNPNTALLYFDWADTNLDDIEKMFYA